MDDKFALFDESKIPGLRRNRGIGTDFAYSLSIILPDRHRDRVDRSWRSPSGGL